MGFNDGVQGGHNVPLGFRAWAVLDGDVPNAAIPKPTSLALMLPGACGAALTRARHLR